MDADSTPRPLSKLDKDLYSTSISVSSPWLSVGQKCLLVLALMVMAIAFMLAPPSGPEVLSPADPAVPTPWSEAAFKYGFSCFVGFVCGFAVRSFLKMALVFCGVFCLALFALEYAGFLTIEWDALDQEFSGILERIKTQAEGFRSFITGSVPNAGLALFGMYVGFRKVR
ncbi:MAG: FUN14 domain-containing protein [Planctomycetota bacterium]|nr:FUN14 domain-containing protein [Planctomycetota bacterium]